MKTHPYLRAFLGGLFVPVLVMPVLLTVFLVARVGLHVAVPIEQALIFPMAVVPSLFGLWNMLWIGSHERTRLSIGLHGALLPLVLMPAGATTGLAFGVLKLAATEAVWFGAAHVPYAVIAPMYLAAIGGYYLVWKYVIGFLDRELGIA